MRLDRLTIGSPKPAKGQLVDTHRFKNLKDVTIDFDYQHWVTVIIGWNGTGKSNVLEALAIIFRDLIVEAEKSTSRRNIQPGFAYKIEYQMGGSESGYSVRIDCDPDRHRDRLQIQIFSKSEAVAADSGSGRWQEISLNELLDRRLELLPAYVFSYYSGASDRMYGIFSDYLEDYKESLRRSEWPGFKKLFYTEPSHSQLVLLALLTSPDPEVRSFLRKILRFNEHEALDSVLFVLQEQTWPKSPEADPRLWNAQGRVSKFLGKLFDLSFAPIDLNQPSTDPAWQKKRRQKKYLYLKNLLCLQKLGENSTPYELFSDLVSAQDSGLIDEVRFQVRLEGQDGKVSFRELSEGEQQLLTVLGLLRFTGGYESLYLLDEPDTHLNPRWSYDYFELIKEFVGDDRDLSHILLTTHNPMAIADLKREQVQILNMSIEADRPRICVYQPENDPRGMGYAAIVTSDMFGIASTLDKSTRKMLEQQRIYAAKDKLSPDQQKDLDDINEKLDRLGFRFFHPDEEYSRYLKLRNSFLEKKFETKDPKTLAERTNELTREEREKIANDLIEELLNETGD